MTAATFPGPREELALFALHAGVSSQRAEMFAIALAAIRRFRKRAGVPDPKPEDFRDRLAIELTGAAERLTAHLDADIEAIVSMLESSPDLARDVLGVVEMQAVARDHAGLALSTLEEIARQGRSETARALAGKELRRRGLV